MTYRNAYYKQNLSSSGKYCIIITYFDAHKTVIIKINSVTRVSHK